MENNIKNVIFYHPSFNYGGVERTNISHAKNLRKLNKKVKIFFYLIF